LSVGDEDIVMTELSRGWLDKLQLSRAATVGRSIDDVFTTEAALMITNVARRALSAQTPIEFSVLLGEPKRKVSLRARPMAPIEDGVILEADLPGQSLAIGDASTDAAFLDLARNVVMNAGSFFVDEPGRTGEIDLSVVLGYPRGHPMGRMERLGELIHPDDARTFQAHRARLAQMTDDQFSVLVTRMRHLDGEWRFVQLRERILVRDPDSTPRRILAFATDVSEKYRLLDSLGAVSNALFTAESHERKRIARELHDSMAQHLVAIDLTLLRLERRMDDPDEQAEVIKEIREALRAAHSEVRTFSYLLHPPDLEVLGFEGSLKKFLRGFALRTGLDLNLHMAEDWPPLGPVRELALFRVVQEALMNVHNHAEARSVEVVLWRSPTGVVLEIADDGVGLSQDQIDALMTQHWGGVGIAGMTARMEQLGGRLEMQKRPKGLLIRAELPAPADETAEAVLAKN
jgi:signal transduction histidine kinase